VREAPRALRGDRDRWTIMPVMAAVPLDTVCADLLAENVHVSDRPPAPIRAVGVVAFLWKTRPAHRSP